MCVLPLWRDCCIKAVSCAVYFFVMYMYAHTVFTKVWSPMTRWRLKQPSMPPAVCADTLPPLPPVSVRRLQEWYKVQFIYSSYIDYMSMFYCIIHYSFKNLQLRVSFTHTIFPQNFTASWNSTAIEMSPRFWQLIPISIALKILPHGKGSLASYMTLYICTRTIYMHTNVLIVEAV